MQQEETLLAHHRLIAPYDALVVARHAEAGTVVKAGDPIFTLIDPATIWIQAYVDEERAGQLALGQPGTIRLRSQPAAEFHGTIARIGIESDRVNEERRVWLTCADCPAEMFLGEQAEVRILTGTRTTALMVPEVAITGFDGHRGTVWTVQDGRLTVRAELTFGARDDRGRVEVIGGLPEGAMIVARVPKGAAEGRRARIGGGAMNLALKDIRHGLFRFVLTCFGLGLLMTVVLAMIGIYNGLVSDALAVVKAPVADVWVVEAGTKGPFAEASSIPADTRDAVARMPGVAEAGAVNYQNVEAFSCRAYAQDSTSSATSPVGPAGRRRSPRGAASAPAISNWWPTARPACCPARRSGWGATASPWSGWSKGR